MIYNDNIFKLPSGKNFLMREDFEQQPLMTMEETSKTLVNLTDASANWDDQTKDNKGVSHSNLYNLIFKQKFISQCFALSWSSTTRFCCQIGAILKHEQPLT